MSTNPHTFTSIDVFKRISFKTRFLFSISTIALVATAMFPVLSASAAPTTGLGTASSFAVLASDGITNSGSTTIYGDIGTFPTPAITGYSSITHTGTNNADNGVTETAKDDLLTAYNEAAAALFPTAVATELGGTTLTPGVYENGTLGITDTLTLDTQGDPDAVFIFRAASTLITAANSDVVFLNGASSCNVFWQIGSSTTLGTDSHIEGTIMTSEDISANTGATIQGRLLSLNGAVTLLTNTITMGICGTPTATATTTTAAPTTTAAITATTAGNTSSTGRASGSASGFVGLDGSLANTGVSENLFPISLAILVFGMATLWVSRTRFQLNKSGKN